jgi:histidine triad (HIT) family protein
MPTDPHCIFCKIIRGEIPSARVLETDSAVAFLDINPAKPGHVLLVPKNHAATIADSDADSIASAAAQLPKLARAILRATAAPGLNIVQNNGREAGQVIGHVHFHIIPRTPADGLPMHWPQGKYEAGAMDQMLARIREALQTT